MPSVPLVPFLQRGVTGSPTRGGINRQRLFRNRRGPSRQESGTTPDLGPEEVLVGEVHAVEDQTVRIMTTITPNVLQ